MSILVLFYCVAAAAYTLSIIALRFGLNRLETHPHNPDRPFVSVIIPARNEGEKISACLTALLQQSYPKHLYEIIVVDDQSTDRTCSAAAGFKKRFKNIHIITLQSIHPDSSAKKTAIDAGIRKSRGDIIMTTDADCRVPRRWIELLVKSFDRHTAAVCSWLMVQPGKRLLGKLETLDSLSLVTVGAAAIGLGYPFMGNGANLAYRKNTYIKLNGFADHIDYASGDDDLLIQKIKSSNDHIVFLDHVDACVLTEASPTLKDFLNQRIRWASKSFIYPKRLLLIEILLYLFFLSLVFGIFLAAFLSFPILYPLGALLVKLSADYMIMKAAGKKIKKTINPVHFIIADILQMAYVLFVGIYAPCATYRWKGRIYCKGRVISRTS